jgi:hypothetical protein
MLYVKNPQKKSAASQNRPAVATPRIDAVFYGLDEVLFRWKFHESKPFIRKNLVDWNAKPMKFKNIYPLAYGDVEKTVKRLHMLGKKQIALAEYGEEHADLVISGAKLLFEAGLDGIYVAGPDEFAKFGVLGGLAYAHNLSPDRIALMDSNPLNCRAAWEQDFGLVTFEGDSAYGTRIGMPEEIIYGQGLKAFEQMIRYIYDKEEAGGYGCDYVAPRHDVAKHLREQGLIRDN